MLTELGFHKYADMIIGNPKSPDYSLTSAGIFIGTEDKHKEKAKILQDLLKKGPTLGTARGAYEKLYPNDYVTGSFKYEKAPKKPFLFGRGKYKKNLAVYEDRVKNPRIFARVGRSGGYDQSAFYNEVIRGKYDSELSGGEAYYA